MTELLKIELHGSQELIQRFRDARSTFALQIMGRVNRLLAQIASKVIQRLSGDPVHRRTGVLAGSVGIDFAKHLGDSIEGSVHAAGPPALYGHFVESGARAHQITAVRARALAFLMDGRKVFAQRVFHPGFAAKPFMRPTADEFRARTTEAFKDLESESE